MAYQVLARKYRPNVLGEVIGQDNVVKALENALATNRLHHAYLFTGTRGVGKTTLARILAKCLNCGDGITATACGKCDACNDINEGNFVDLLEIDAASRTGVDDTRSMLENVQYMPSQGRFKIYIIDEVHMLSAASFNALLKTLEEPPDHVKFILATTNPQKVLPTVLSRCLQFNLRNISADEVRAQLARVLESEEVTFDAEALTAVARASQGSMRDALSITDQAIARCGSHLETQVVVDMLGTARSDEVLLLLDTLARGDRTGLFAVTTGLAERSVDFADVMQGLGTAFHELAMSAATQSKVQSEFADFAGKFEPNWLQQAYQILIMGGRDLQYAPNPQIGFEMTMIRLLDFAPSDQAGVTKSPTKTVNSPTLQSEPNPRRQTKSAPTVESRDVKQSSIRKSPVQAKSQQTSPTEELPEFVQQLQKTFQAKLVNISTIDAA